MKRACSTAALCVAALAVSAQVRWLGMEHNFGAFSEDLGAVDAVFKFVNEGDEPVRILDARATCGCTQPELSKGNIEPGDTGIVKVTYLASGRPGKFSKNVYVKLSSNPTQQRTLTVKGVVIGSNATLTSRYPVTAGMMKLRTSTVAFGEVTRGKLKTIYVEGYNQSPDTIYPSIEGLPDYIDLTISPEAVPPGEQVQFGFTLQTLRNPEWGITGEKFTLIPDKGAESAEMDFFTIMTEDFGMLTPGERVNAPVAEVKPMRVDLGSVMADSGVRKLEYEISNNGKLPLMIRRVQAVDSSIVSFKLSSDKIKPGKKGRLTIEFDPAKAETDFVNARISFITNDPDYSLIVARLTAEITR